VRVEGEVGVEVVEKMDRKGAGSEKEKETSVSTVKKDMPGRVDVFRKDREV
jgi:hypothetical protein